MKEPDELRLQVDFPFMERAVNCDNDDGATIYQRYGCECHSGWFDLIHSLCSDISARYMADGASPDIIVRQIKEKFAGLRFYYSFAGEPNCIQAIDSMSGQSIRLYPRAAKSDADNKLNQLRMDIAEIVKDYEAKSYSVCEFCGSPGQPRWDLRWKKTLCDACYFKIL